jgi:hypothetical protein
MRALRVVGILENDGEFSVVLEDAERRERYTVPADEQLRAAARGDLTRLGQNAIEVESQLRPREIQARIRAGASVEQVATMAGVPLQKIERFAYPVLLERSRTAEVAQRAHPVRADGPDSRMLGDVVANTFGVRGQEYADVEWDSWKGEDGKWVVALSWSAGHSDIRAHWTFQPGANGGTVTALDENAFDLVEGLPARPLRPVGPVIDMARPDDAGPGPAPVPELRAAASEGGRRGPEQAYPSYDRSTTRTAPEPRRPAPPAPRQPVESRPGDPYPAQGDAAPPERRPEAPRERYAEPQPEPRRADEQPPVEQRAEPAPAPEPTPEPAPPAATETAPATPDPAPQPSSSQPSSSQPSSGQPQPGQPQPGEPQPGQPSSAPAAAEASAAAPERAEPAGELAAEPAPVEEPAEPAAEAPAEAAAEEPEKESESAPETPARPAAKPAARRTKKGKPVMPSWDEVLLGVRGRD